MTTTSRSLFSLLFSLASFAFILATSSRAFADDEAPPPLPPTPSEEPAPPDPPPAVPDTPTPAPAAKPSTPTYRAPHNALSVQLMAFLNRGVTVQYERQLASRVSLATSIGHRWSGGKSFDTSETGFGLQGRVWLLGRAPLTKFDGPAMVGPFVGLRFDLAQTRVEDGDRLVGSSVRLGESLSLGARIVIARRFELTPEIGCGFRTEVDPRGHLATWTRFEPVRFGMTAGVMF